MMASDPSSKPAISQAINASLRASLGDRLADETRESIALTLADEYIRLGPEKARAIDRPVPGTGDKAIYPIHESDLKLIDDSAALAVAVGAATSSGWLGVLTKLVVFLYRLRRKRGRLEGEPALVLLALKEAGEPGLTVTQLRDRLKDEYCLHRSHDQIRVLLQGLQDVRLADGTRTRFSDEQQGRWFTVDV